MHTPSLEGCSEFDCFCRRCIHGQLRGSVISHERGGSCIVYVLKFVLTLIVFAASVSLDRLATLQVRRRRISLAPLLCCHLGLVRFYNLPPLPEWSCTSLNIFKQGSATFCSSIVLCKFEVCPHAHEVRCIHPCIVN